MNNRAVFFIDGFNVYHSIRDAIDIIHPKYHKYKWLNYYALAKCIARNKPPYIDDVKRVLYFTSFCDWDTSKMKKHQILVKALQNEGVEVILGKFSPLMRTCKACCLTYEDHIEKRTDVNIEIKMLELAYEDQYDIAYLVSGDNDLIPAILSVITNFPNKKICVVFPFRRKSKTMSDIVIDNGGFIRNIRESYLRKSRFPNQIRLANGEIIDCPLSWR